MKKILVADDSSFMRMVLTEMLVEAGYEVHTAKNGIEVLEVYQKVNPDLVTLDITMPDMTGLEALKYLKQISPNARVIMCSAMGQKHMVTEAVKSGAIDFLVKPLEKEKVLASVAKALG